MPDVYCMNCEHKCSDQAPTCPKCGHPLVAPEQIEPLAAPVQGSQLGPSANVKTAITVCSVAVVTAVSIAYYASRERGPRYDETGQAETARSQSAVIDFTFDDWQDALNRCHADPDYILTFDDILKAMTIYGFWQQIPTFAANKKRMFNIVAGCYYANRDKPLEDWKYMFSQKWISYWDELTICKGLETYRHSEIERRAKNARYVRKETKTPPYTGASTRQEVTDVCSGSTAQIDIEDEIQVVVSYRKAQRGKLRSSAEVKEMMCEDICDFQPGNPDRCCECESAVVDFVFHQKEWE